MWLPSLLAIVAVVGPVSPRLYLAPHRGSDIDTAKARVMLAAVLGIDIHSTDLRVAARELPMHRGAVLLEGSAPGPHTPRRALVVGLPDGSLVPVGCRAGRLVVQAVVPPAITENAFLDYVALLAGLDGAVPGVGRPITALGQVPTSMADWAARQGIVLAVPSVRNLPDGAREVTTLVLVDALYRVVVRVGPTRDLDGVLETTLLVGVPPG